MIQKIAQAKSVDPQSTRSDGNLQGLLNSSRHEEYLPEESDNEKYEGEDLEFPDFNNNQESPGFLNYPSWLAYEKEAFVKPEREYRNIIPPKLDKCQPSNLPNRLSRFINLEDLRNDLAPFEESISTSATNNATDFDFLIPIPENNKNIAMIGSDLQSTTENVVSRRTQRIKHEPVNSIKGRLEKNTNKIGHQEGSKTVNYHSGLKVHNSMNNKPTEPTKDINSHRNNVKEVKFIETNNKINEKQTDKKKTLSLLSIFHKKNATSNRKKNKEYNTTYKGPDESKIIKKITLRDFDDEFKDQDNNFESLYEIYPFVYFEDSGNINQQTNSIDKKCNQEPGSDDFKDAEYVNYNELNM